MVKYYLPKPRIIHDNWAIIDNATLPPFEYPFACINAINSHCVEADSVEECIDICKKSGSEPVSDPEKTPVYSGSNCINGYF